MPSNAFALTGKKAEKEGTASVGLGVIAFVTRIIVLFVSVVSGIGSKTPWFHGFA